MKNSKAYSGFTTVDIAIVVTILSFVFAGATVAHSWVQVGANRAVLFDDASSLADAINYFNEFTDDMIFPPEGENRLTLSDFNSHEKIYTSEGASFIKFRMEKEDLIVIFESVEHKNRAISFIDFNDYASVDRNNINNSNGKTIRD